MGFFESDEEERLAAQEAAELKDWRGKPIEVGTRIVYPGRNSSHIWMTEAEVVEISEETIGYRTEPVPVLKVKRLRMASYSAALTVEPKVVKLTELHRVTVVY